jgi:hypothetical protein
MAVIIAMAVAAEPIGVDRQSESAQVFEVAPRPVAADEGVSGGLRGRAGMAVPAHPRADDA